MFRIPSSLDRKTTINKRHNITNRRSDKRLIHRQGTGFYDLHTNFIVQRFCQVQVTKQKSDNASYLLFNIGLNQFLETLVVVLFFSTLLLFPVILFQSNEEVFLLIIFFIILLLFSFHLFNNLKKLTLSFLDEFKEDLPYIDL